MATRISRIQFGQQPWFNPPPLLVNIPAGRLDLESIIEVACRALKMPPLLAAPFLALFMMADLEVDRGVAVWKSSCCPLRG
jgi:hypothetical protein